MTLRNILFQTHLWVGLILGILFVLLGISGTALMFRGTPGIGQRVPEIQATAPGAALPLEQIAAAARAETQAAPEAITTIVLPQADGMPSRVRFTQPGEQSRFSRAPDILVDPASGAILGTFEPGLTPVMRFFHDLHGQLFLGRTGRQLVGWLGVGMTFLGLSGLYLWWPKAKVWKYAFMVRRQAKGLRFHRELHGAVGIWTLIVFLIVSVSGVAIVFPQAVRSSLSLVTAEAAGTAPPGRRGAPEAPMVEIGGAAITADKAIDLARQANPDRPVQSVTLASTPRQAITVTVGPGRGTPVFVDPYRASVIVQEAAQTPTLASKVSSTMRALHAGEGYGPVYWAAVLLSGFLPALFVFTGTVMWLKKRRRVSKPRTESADALQ